MSTVQNITIYSEIDLQSYLRRTKETLGYSFSLLADHLGTTRTKVKQMFSGKATVPQKLITRLASFLKLNEEEANYLSILRKISVTQNAESIAALYKRVTSIRTTKIAKTHNRDLTDVQLTVYTEWYYLPILQAFDLKDVNGRLSVIHQAFRGKLSEKEIEEAANTLVKVGLLETNEDGYRKTTVFTHFMSNVPNTLLRNNHRNMVRKALESIDGMPFDKRYIMGTTMTIKQDRKEDLQTEIRNFIAHISENYASDDGDLLERINIQMFNLAETKNEAS